MLGGLGQYTAGPLREEDELFEARYAEQNWHGKYWTLQPRQQFCGPKPGSKIEYGEPIGPVESFLDIWSDGIQRKIVKESNAYAEWRDPTTGRRKGRLEIQGKITLKEHRQWLGICILMAVRTQPRMRDFWAVRSDVLHCKQVASTMPRKRFLYLLQCLHIVSKESLTYDRADHRYDPIGQIRWLLDNLVANFQTLWNASPYLCVDESMVQYNGRYCSFKQYLPLKPITHGIKVWCLCCSVTKYVLNFEVYVGAANEVITGLPQHACGAGAGVVSRLTNGWEGKWYTIAMDNYFTSPMLFENLLNRGFYAVGTARQGRVGFPRSLCVPEKTPRGSLEIRVHRDREMAAIHWQDTKGVSFLSTAADPMVRGGTTTTRHTSRGKSEIPTSPIQKLYSSTMRGVDTQDQLRASYTTQIFTKKWWHRLFFFGLDSATTNAYLRYKHICAEAGQKAMDHEKFMLVLAHGLMECPLSEDFGTAPTSRHSGLFEVSQEEPAEPAPQTVQHTGDPEEDPMPSSQESVNCCTLNANSRDPPSESLPAHVYPSAPVATLDGEGGALGDVHSIPAGRSSTPSTLPRRDSSSAEFDWSRAPRTARRSTPCHSVKGTLRRRCRVCKRRTVWVCKGCHLSSMCPGACFLDFHGSANI